MRKKIDKLRKFLEKNIVFFKLGFEFIKSIVSIAIDMYK
jgi:hypothetical protein